MKTSSDKHKSRPGDTGVVKACFVSVVPRQQGLEHIRDSAINLKQQQQYWPAVPFTNVFNYGMQLCSRLNSSFSGCFLWILPLHVCLFILYSRIVMVCVYTNIMYVAIHVFEHA